MSQTSGNNILHFLKEYCRALFKGNFPSLSAFRYYSKWKALLNKDPLSSKLPWITFEAIEFIDKNISKSHRIFEYGGGASTLFFLSKVAEVVTVEHDQQWFQMLKEKIGHPDSVRWSGQLVMPEKFSHALNLDKSLPTDYFSGHPTDQDVTYKSYSTFICRYEDEHFDLVLIDGRARTSCLFHAIPKVKVGGFLVLDNSERKYYLPNNLANLQKHYKLLINHAGPVPYSSYFSQTTIWQRIK
jgi:hypothetical protein